MSVIQIRGTSGSGKTTVMRALMAQLGPWEPQYAEGRKKPLWYSSHSDLVILGHYESTCGGCDNVGSAREVFELIRCLEGGTFHGNPRTILCEGLLLSEDCRWTSQMEDVHVFFLTTPLEQCLRQVESRRRAAGNEKPLNPANTTKRVAVIEKARSKLLGLGVDCRRVSPEQACKVILQLIRTK